MLMPPWSTQRAWASITVVLLGVHWSLAQRGEADKTTVTIRNGVFISTVLFSVRSRRKWRVIINTLVKVDLLEINDY